MVCVIHKFWNDITKFIRRPYKHVIGNYFKWMITREKKSNSTWARIESRSKQRWEDSTKFFRNKLKTQKANLLQHENISRTWKWDYYDTLIISIRFSLHLVVARLHDVRLARVTAALVKHHVGWCSMIMTDLKGRDWMSLRKQSMIYKTYSLEQLHSVVVSDRKWIWQTHRTARPASDSALHRTVRALSLHAPSSCARRSFAPVKLGNVKLNSTLI